MKKLFLLIPLLFILSACSNISSENEEPKKPSSLNYDNNVVIYTDPETNIQYFIFDSFKQGGMTVRLNPDGTPMIKGEE